LIRKREGNRRTIEQGISNVEGREEPRGQGDKEHHGEFGELTSCKGDRLIRKCKSGSLYLLCKAKKSYRIKRSLHCNAKIPRASG
jgi:hypothetical protein